MKAINPATESEIADYPEHSPEQINHILAAAQSAFQKWKGVSIEQRGGLLVRVAEGLRANRAALSELMTGEMGKPIVAAEAEIDKCAGACEYVAANGGRFLAAETISSDASRSYVRFDPLGPILAIMPWNFPFWQLFRAAAGALVAGNVILLKHAPNVPGCSLAIEKLFLDARFPPGVFSSILISDNSAAQNLIARDEIAAATLTGSDRAGMAVAAEAGRALKKVVLELGGSDAFIVLEDAAVESVAATAAAARCINSGQSCIAAKRFIVVASIAGRFERAMTEAMSRIKVGDPMDRSTQMGPLARNDLLENLDRQVRRSVAAGARLLLGGKRSGNVGFFYPPTVLAEVEPGMAAFDEETFGPVAAIVRAKDADDAIRLANLSSYGLGASIWTAHAVAAERLAARIEAGCVFINGIVKSDPRLPFGGVKRSGWGRELSQIGIREFVNAKTVWVKD